MAIDQISPGGYAKVGGLALKNGIIVFTGTTAPTNGVTGAGKAGPGSLYVRTDGTFFTNTGTKASPVWALSALGVAAASAEITISAADIVATGAGKFGHANGYPLVAAPAAGSALSLISATLVYDYATAAYTGGGNITVNYAAGSAITGLVSAANSVGAAADKVVQFVPLSTVGNPLAVATGINLVAAAAFTQPGTAAGVIRVQVAYRVHVTGL